MLTSNVKKYASIEFIAQKKTHKVVFHDMVMFSAVFFLTLSDLYRVNLTSKKLNIFIFQLGTPEYHNLDTKTTKLTRIQPYLYCQWPFWIYAK